MDDLKKIVNSRGFDANHEWPKLLYYATNMFGVSRSLVDDETFFLSPRGKYDPHSEMLATIEAMFQPIPDDAEAKNLHARCQYPRRVKWIIDKTGIDPAALPLIECKWFDDWTKDHSYNGASLVFSSSYPNNPSSLFGHTFIRLHDKVEKQGRELLDGAINFSAFPDTNNPILYTIKGTMGGFPGRFSYSPYYHKVQEYSNAESRDLWEYRLKFSEADVKNMIRAVWEMGQHYIDYYYFDENCSEVVLHLLEATRPDLDLTRFKVWVIPSDTVRVVTSVPGLAEKPVYRPSALSRFLWKYRHLSPTDASLAENILLVNDVDLVSSQLSSLNKNSQARLIDAVVDFIDYDEKLAGTKEAVKYGAMRSKLLQLRASLPILPESPVELPQFEQPDTGHESTRLRFGGGVMRQKSSFLEAEWRPALHDHLSSNQGYAAGLGIDFWDVNLRYFKNERRGLIDSFYLIRILSLPELESLVRKPAWNLSLGTSIDYTCANKSPTKYGYCYKSQFKGGGGLTLPLRDKGIMFFSMANLAFGHHAGISSHWFIEPSVQTGVTYSWREILKVDLMEVSSSLASKANMPLISHGVEAHVSGHFSQNQEIRFDAKRISIGFDEYSLGYLVYF